MVSKAFLLHVCRSDLTGSWSVYADTFLLTKGAISNILPAQVNPNMSEQKTPLSVVIF